MQQPHADDVLLNAWAGAPVPSIAAGYDFVARSRAISRPHARRLVHKALERRGINPHVSPNVIQAWLRIHRDQTGELR